MTDLATDVSDLDALDCRIVAALQIDGRAAWGRIASVLGEAERTVARRAERLIRARVLSVLGLVQTQRCGLGEPAIVALSCDPGSGGRVAGELADIPNTRWVSLTTGANDCIAEVVWQEPDFADFVLDRLASIRGIQGHHTYGILKYFKVVHEWHLDVLTEQQTLALRSPVAPDLLDLEPAAETLTGEDELVLDLLSRNGRMSHAALAEELGVSPSTARRRLESLRERGILLIRAEIEPSLLGLGVEAVLWVKCQPAQIDAVGRELGLLPSARYVAAVTGAFQLVGQFAVDGKASLYELLTAQVGQIPGVESVETALSLRALKRGFVRRDGIRLSGDALPISALRHPSPVVPTPSRD